MRPNITRFVPVPPFISTASLLFHMEFQSPPNLYLLLCLSILFHSSFNAQASSNFRYCDDVNYPVKISRVDITPDPVVRARPATFKISAATDEVICGGKWVIRVAYIGLVVHKEIHDLCKEVSCPLAAGKFVLTHTQKLPLLAPPGTYTVEMSLMNEMNELFTCITFNFKIVFGSSVSDI